VIGISPPSAKRRYRDKSSFTSARATARVRLPAGLEPLVRFGLRDDGEDFDGRFPDVIKHPDFPNPFDADEATILLLAVSFMAFIGR